MRLLYLVKCYWQSCHVNLLFFCSLFLRALIIKKMAVFLCAFSVPVDRITCFLHVSANVIYLLICILTCIRAFLLWVHFLLLSLPYTLYDSEIRVLLHPLVPVLIICPFKKLTWLWWIILLMYSLIHFSDFIENFYIYVHQGDWPISFFFCSILINFCISTMLAL